MTDGTDLLLCPFCGGTARIMSVSVYRVVCIVCAAQGPSGSTCVDSIRRWNTRNAVGSGETDRLDDAIYLSLLGAHT